MKRATLAIPLVALVAATPARADEAWVRQISVGGVSVSLPEISAVPRASDGLAIPVEIGHPADLPSAPRMDIDIDAYPLAPAPSDGALARVTSIGDGNTALLLQAGRNAASIRQRGDDNLAALMQSGADNRAAISQEGRGRHGAILQSGRGNRALILQN